MQQAKTWAKWVRRDKTMWIRLLRRPKKTLANEDYSSIYVHTVFAHVIIRINALMGRAKCKSILPEVKLCC